MGKPEIVVECPLGAKCEEIKDGKINRCLWYMHIKGTDPQTGEDVDTWNCVMSWMPILTIENTHRSIQTGAAVESFRNEMVKGNNMLLSLAASAKKIS